MRRLWIFGLACLALAMALYANVLDGEFQFDDQSSIVENSAVHAHDPGRIFRFWPGRFLPYLSFALQHRFGGLDPWPYHLWNACVHGLTGFLVGLWIYVLWGGAAPDRTRAVAALAGSALFLVHPLATQAVSYVVQRATSMAALFSVAALAAYCHALRLQSRRRWMALAGIACVGAMFCKEFAIVLPLALMLCDLAIGPPTGRGRRCLALAPLLLVVPLVAGSMRSFGVAGSEGLLEETARVSRIEYARTQCEAFARYLGLLAWPARQSVEHDLPWHRDGDWGRTMLFALLPLAWLAASFLAWRRGARRFALALALFLLFLAPESSVFPIQDAMFEHRLYLPLASIALLVASFVTRTRFGRARWILLPICVALALTTVQRNRVWATPYALWSDAVDKSPGSGRARVALGVELAQQGRFDEAQRELERGLRLRPESARGWTNLGNLRLMRSDLRGAEEAYRRALAVRPSHANAWYNLAISQDRMGRPVDAEASYRRCLELEPANTAALNALAALLLRLGRLDEARGFAERAAELGAPAAPILERLR